MSIFETYIYEVTLALEPGFYNDNATWVHHPSSKFWEWAYRCCEKKLKPDDAAKLIQRLRNRYQ